MERIEIDKNEPLQPGDIIELHYKTFGPTWIKATQVAILERRLKDKPEYELISSQYLQNRLILTIKIRQPAAEPEMQVQKASIVSAALIIKAITVVAVGVLIWMSLDKIYKISESPAGKIGIAGLGTMALAAGVAGLLAILGKSK